MIGNIRLLIVDSHEQVRRELAAKLFLRLNPQVVGWAGERDAAARLLRELQANVILLDAQMAGGFALCRDLVVQQAETKVVVLTSYASEQERQDAFQAGAAAYLLKSIPSEELLQCIRTIHGNLPEALLVEHRVEALEPHQRSAPQQRPQVSMAGKGDASGKEEAISQSQRIGENGKEEPRDETKQA